MLSCGYLILFQLVVTAVIGDIAVCPRFESGSAITSNPPSLSANGPNGEIIPLEMSYQYRKDENGNEFYCYMTADGYQSPTLVLRPGQSVQLTLHNDLAPTGGSYYLPSSVANADNTNLRGRPQPSEPYHFFNSIGSFDLSHRANKCAPTHTAPSNSTNLHFHGMHLSPMCPGDQVVHTVVDPGYWFMYEFTVPADHPPGLYWYHPHIFGLADLHTLGGASGLIIIDGLQNIHPEIIGLPEIVIAIRNSAILSSDDAGLNQENQDGASDIPQWDISVNYVPIPYNPTVDGAANYNPPSVAMLPETKHFLRIGNIGADVIINLQLIYDNVTQPMTVVAIDGVPVKEMYTVDAWYLPPASRVELIVTSPCNSVVNALMVTTAIDTGIDGDSDPSRPLFTLDVHSDAITANGNMRPTVTASTTEVSPKSFRSEESIDTLLAAQPTVTRHLYFNEKPSDPSNPDSEPIFYITVDGRVEVAYDPTDPSSMLPKIVTVAGSIEDWVIQNRATEEHAFHIHQLHFIVLEQNGEPIPVDRIAFRDTFDIPAWNGDESTAFSTIKVRMEFGPSTVGDFVYHCHILDHEDKGMMAKIRVLPQSLQEDDDTVEYDDHVQ